MEKLARALSIAFSPLLVPTYGIILAVGVSYLMFSPLQARLMVSAVTFVATCVLPVIFICLLWKLKVIRDPGLNERGERTGTYLFTTACYIGLAVYFYYVNAPLWLIMFPLGGAGALICQTVINLWWKISGHAAAQGGMLAMLFYLMCVGGTVEDVQWLFLGIVLLTGVIGTCRLVLGYHTPWQIAAGLVNGFAWVFCLAFFIR